MQSQKSSFAVPSFRRTVVWLPGEWQIKPGRLLSILLAILVAALGSSSQCAEELTEEDAEALKKGQTAFESREFQEAITLLLPLHEKFPSIGEIPRVLTHAYYELGQYDKAREKALAAIGLGQLTPDMLTRLAQIDQQRDDRMALANTVELLTVLEPNNYRWRLVHGDLLAGSQALDESAAVYRRLLEARPESAPVYLRLGNVQMQMNGNEAAVINLTTAWHVGAAHPRLPRTIAGLYKQLGDDRQALAWTERALAASETPDESLQLDVAQLCFALEDWPRAKAAASTLTGSSDTNTRGRAHVLLGRLAMRDELVDQAMTHWRQAIVAGIESKELIAVVAAHLFNQGEFQRAAELLERVVAVEEPDEQYVRFLVISLIRCDKRSLARERLRRYVELYGLNDDAQKLIRLWAKGGERSQ